MSKIYKLLNLISIPAPQKAILKGKLFYFEVKKQNIDWNQNKNDDFNLSPIREEIHL